MKQVPQFDILGVTEARDLLQNTLDQALPVLMIEGEISGFSINKNTFVFFDIKDEVSGLHCFMMRGGLIQPIEDGMTVRLVARPRITAKGQLSLTVEAYELVGEGSLQRAFELLKRKLDGEGLFAPERKRQLPFAPSRVGLVASGESAAYGDFIKILNSRWVGVEVVHSETSVQGARAVSEIVKAIEAINRLPKPPEVLVLTRGGGSLEDLAAFNTEQVARAVAASRIPTIVAIGHEVDVSLAELAADMRASTPSNAAELLVPDKKQILSSLGAVENNLNLMLDHILKTAADQLAGFKNEMTNILFSSLESAQKKLESCQKILAILDPKSALKRGFILALDSHQKIIRSAKSLKVGDKIYVQFSDGNAKTTVEEVQ